MSYIIYIYAIRGIGWIGSTFQIKIFERKSKFLILHDFQPQTFMDPKSEVQALTAYWRAISVSRDFYWPADSKKIRLASASQIWMNIPEIWRRPFFSRKEWIVLKYPLIRGELSVLGDVMMSDTTLLKFDEWILKIIILGTVFLFKHCLRGVVPYKQACFFLNLSPIMAL